MESNTPWFAAVVRPKSEKLVHRLLGQKQIESYVPLVERVRRYQSKIRKSQIPLLNGYVFVHLEPLQLIKVLETEHVYKVVKFQGKPAEVSQVEIDFLKAITGEAYEARQVFEPLAKGDRVMIKGGQLTGVKGTLVEFEGKERVLVELQTLGVNLAMSIPLSHLIKEQ